MRRTRAYRHERGTCFFSYIHQFLYIVDALNFDYIFRLNPVNETQIGGISLQNLLIVNDIVGANKLFQFILCYHFRRPLQSFHRFDLSQSGRSPAMVCGKMISEITFD